ncbi:phosphatase PAP2 family protein [Mesorhizobium sp. J428]|uniref:phosphatase PAP2 family protein n=1 Tax=Mesorhizobium sp. J428 TaxID=2898440 RepID=UPI0021513122|nr:phosphatase PAP2 family protein [Mesorhizobium sp. J428]MCR5855610.1 phosphatase PAP2 family protein [Mesorhizobium sp. J428]
MKNRITDLVRGLRDLPITSAPFVLAAIAGVGAYAFLQIADEVSEAEFDALDRGLLMAFRQPDDLATPLGPPWFREFMAELTALGGYPLLTIIVALVVGYLIVARMFGPALFTVLAVVSGTAVSQLLKVLYDRPRPDVVEQLVTVHTASFPSGHAAMSAVVYLTLASLIVRLVDSTAIRVYVLVVALLLTVSIGISRIYLGVHWPSDVAAGWAFGIAWASLSWLAVAALRALRGREGEG